MWDSGREKKQQPWQYPALLWLTCTLRTPAAALSPHALVPHAASVSPRSTARTSARARRYSQGRQPCATAAAQTERTTQPPPPPPPHPREPRCRSFPSLCPRPANHQAARAATGIIDRRHQPIAARQRAVRGTRALKQTTVGSARALPLPVAQLR